MATMVKAGNYTIDVGQTQTIYCSANAPAGYITHAFYSLVDPNDAQFVALQSRSDELCADIVGLRAKASIKIQVTYAYTYIGTYDNRKHVGSGTYYDYITVEGGVNPTKVQIEQSEVTMNVGSTIDLYAKLTPQNASTDFQWGAISTLGQPYNFNITYIGNKASITAKKAGYIYLVVETSNGLQSFCTVTAVDNKPQEVSIPQSFTAYIGEEIQLPITLLPKESATTFTWDIEDTNILSISSKGIISGISEGRTNVVCRTANGLNSEKCVVDVEYREPTDISINTDDIKMSVGDMRKLTYTLTPNNAKTNIKWFVNPKDTKSVIISEDGMLLAKGIGTAQVVAECENGLAASCNVSVLPELESLEIPKQLELCIGDEYSITPNLYPSNSLYDISWTSEDPSIVSVNDGILNAVSVGIVSITATNYNGVKSECLVYVKELKTLNVWNREGEKTTFLLSEVPQIKYGEEGSVIVNAGETEISFSLSEIGYISVADENEPFIETGIGQTSASSYINPTIVVAGGNLQIRNAGPNSTVRIFKNDGRMIYEKTADSSGNLSFAISKKELYIVRVNSKTFKIMKR